MRFKPQPFAERRLWATFLEGTGHNGITPAMNASFEMKTEEVLRAELDVLRNQHRDLDDAIHALHEKGTADSFTLKRLKKQKLRLKDKITQLEDRITPDIIA